MVNFLFFVVTALGLCSQGIASSLGMGICIYYHDEITDFMLRSIFEFVRFWVVIQLSCLRNIMYALMQKSGVFFQLL